MAGCASMQPLQGVPPAATPLQVIGVAVTNTRKKGMQIPGKLSHLSSWPSNVYFSWEHLLCCRMGVHLNRTAVSPALGM